jgi:glycosyltransferase involved in cell wall biosynthesis
VRVLMIMPSRVRGGAEEHTLTIARAALASGWEVHAAFPSVEATASLVADFRSAGAAFHALDIMEDTPNGEYDWRSRLRDFRNAARTRRVIRSVDPDVAHVALPWPNYAYGSQQALARRRVPAVVMFHLVPEDKEVSSRRQGAYEHLRACGQRWVAVSEFSRGHLQRLYGVQPSEVDVIRNGVPLDVVDDGERQRTRAEVRAEFGLAPSARILLTVGRLADQKGHALLVPSIGRITAAHPDATFMWVGDGERRSELEAGLITAGVRNRVVLTGVRTDVRRLMAAADLFVFPTLFEGLPLTLLEAMATGLPVVTSDAAGLGEIVVDRQYGRVFRSRDSAALEVVLLEALASPDDLRAMAVRARRLMEEQFDEARMCRDVLNLLGSIGRRTP